MLTITGALPPNLRENTPADAWSGTLGITSPFGAIAGIEAVGPWAMYLDLVWDALHGTLTFRPAAMIDYEAFAVLGQDPVITLSLQVRQASGLTFTDNAVISIAVQDVDDTAPSDLHFAIGGTVEAWAIGAVIGTLAVIDRDTPSDGPFTFTFTEEDAWRFEVVDGNVLKLRDGVTLGLDDIPSRPILIEVSDGHQSAGFLLTLTVLDPWAAPPPPPVLAAGEMQGEVALATSERAVVLAEAAGFDAITPGDPVLLTLAGGEDGGGDAEGTWLPATTGRLDFLDGRIETDPDGVAARAAALHQALLGEAADGTALARAVAALEGGAGLAALAARLIAAASGAVSVDADDAAFVTALYQQAAGREPGEAELALQLGRLAAGTPREQVAVDLALSLVEAAEGPLWVALPFGHEGETAADSAFHATAAAPWVSDPDPAPAAPGVATDLMLF